MYSVHYAAVCIMYAIENNTICVHHRNGTYCATRDKHVLDSGLCISSTFCNS